MHIPKNLKIAYFAEVFVIRNMNKSQKVKSIFYSILVNKIFLAHQLLFRWQEVRKWKDG